MYQEEDGDTFTKQFQLHFSIAIRKSLGNGMNVSHIADLSSKTCLYIAP